MFILQWILWFNVIVTFVFGIMFLFMPKTLGKVCQVSNKVLFHTDESIYKERIAVGAILLAISVVLLINIWNIMQRG